MKTQDQAHPDSDPGLFVSSTTRERATVREQLSRPANAGLVLLLVAVLAYGLLLPQMGFYWDELPMSWIRYELGPEAMTRYFSTNRPVWGILYQLTTRFLPQIPIYWEVFALFWRWLSAVLVWAISAELWPARRRLALVVALCFLLYPGFNQQWTSYLYSHFFIVLCFLLASFLCMLWSARSRRWFWPLMLVGMALSALNLWMMEYFYALELLRPILILKVVLSGPDSEASRHRVRRFLAIWAPYVLVFAANILWRLFVFNNQIYQPTLISELRASPVSGVMALAKTISSQLYVAGVAAWAQIFPIFNPGSEGPRTTAFYAAVVLLTALVVALFLRAVPASSTDAPPRAWWPILLGFAALLAAGGPFWLTGLEVTTAYPANRFTLPFMLGASLLIAGILELISPRISVWLVVGLIGLAAGRQALWADAYRHDWITQKSMFWQMLWRAPGIAPGTLVLMNEGALPYYADNSLTGPLNWIYDPENRSGSMDYVLFYPTSRRGGTLPALQPGQAITYDFISEVFSGNTSQTLAFYFQPPGCLRLLDPVIDSRNHLIPDASLMRDAAPLSSSGWIVPESNARMPQIYGPEPYHGWCYYFEQAELAAQLHDWGRVAGLGEIAFSLSDYPNDPVERFVFIEGYSHEANWSRALELSKATYKVSRPFVGPLLCELWKRINSQTPRTAEQSAAVAKVKSMFACTSE